MHRAAVSKKIVILLILFLSASFYIEKNQGVGIVRAESSSMRNVSISIEVVNATYEPFSQWLMTNFPNFHNFTFLLQAEGGSFDWALANATRLEFLTLHGEIIPETPFGFQQNTITDRQIWLNDFISQWRNATGTAPPGFFTFQPDTYSVNYLLEQNVSYVTGYCFDQYRIDYMTERGGWQLPYYASRKNALCPENSSNGGIVVFPFLTWDWIDRYTASHLYNTETLGFPSPNPIQSVENIIDASLDSSWPFGFVAVSFSFDWYYTVGFLTSETAVLNHVISDGAYQKYSLSNFTSWFKSNYPATPSYHILYTSPNSGQSIEWYYNREFRVARIGDQVVSYVNYAKQPEDPFLRVPCNVNFLLPSDDPEAQIDTSLRFTIDALGGGVNNPPADQTATITYNGDLADFSNTPEEILYLSFGEGSGRRTSDHSENGWNASLNNASWTSGKLGCALSFDGATSYVDVPHNLGFSKGSKLTISAWIYPTTLKGAHPILSQNMSSGGGIIFSQDDAVLAFWANGFSNPARASFHKGQQLILNAWNFVAVTYDDATGLTKFYLGAYSNSQTIAPYQIIDSSETWIGKYATVMYYNGSIDEVRIYPRILSTSELTSPDTLFYLPFDEGLGTITNDQSENGYTGTLHDVEWVDGKRGYSLSFNNISGYVGVPSTIGLPNGGALSICAWIFPKTIAGRHPIFSGGGTLFAQQGDQLIFWANTNDPWVLSEFEQKLVPLIWNFVAVTYDDETGNVTFYVGIFKDVNSFKLNHRLSSSTETSIGKYSTDWYYYGHIDEVHAYEKVLTAEINDLYTTAAL